MSKVTIYTDGAAKGNPGPGGFGSVLISGRARKELSGGFLHTTNNRMEILAAAAALEALTKPCVVTLHSDSRYLIDSMTKGWLLAWKKNHWRKKDKQPVKNPDLWQRLDAAAEPHQITWKWVKGHAGHAENERCDELANAAAYAPDRPPDTGFLASDPDLL